MAEDIPEGPKISRRNFLKAAGATVAVAAASYLGLREASRSPEIELKPTVKVLDFFDLDKIKDESLQEMGVSDQSTKQELLKVVPKDENQAKLLMIMLLKQHYQNHGKDVISVKEKTAEYLHSGQTVIAPEHASVVGAIEFGELEFDEIGNPTLHFNISSEVIDNLISQSPESIINVSLELGKFSFKYSLYEKRYKYPDMGRQFPKTEVVGGETRYRDYRGGIITKDQYDQIMEEIDTKEIVLLDPNERDVRFLDGYAGEDTFLNLEKLAVLAEKYPEKMFFAAGGNPISKVPDIRAARSELERLGKWPKNLLMVGYQVNGLDPVFGTPFAQPASYGSDIYISDEYLGERGFLGASSYAVPTAVEVARSLIAKGYKTQEQVKLGLLQLTREKELSIDSEKIRYRLLDLEKAKNKFM